MQIFGRTAEYLRMIRFSHSVFALPFAYSSMMLAGTRSEITFHKFFWITAAMVSARSAAMGFNRLVDKEFDAKNPRTSSRALPKGRINRNSVIVFISAFLVIFFISAGMLNKLALALSPLAVVITFFYSFAKRLTSFSHYILGLSLGIAPVGAWIGITGKMELLPMIISLGVIFWVAGFDIIYSLSDIDVDRRDGLKAIPARMGVKKALLISRLSHTIAFLLFTYIYIVNCSVSISLIFPGIILFMLFYQHIALKPENPASVEKAFFLGNSVISVVFFAGIFISSIMS